MASNSKPRKVTQSRAREWVITSVSLYPDSVPKLDRIARGMELTRSALIRKILGDFLDNYPD